MRRTLPYIRLLGLLTVGSLAVGCVSMTLPPRLTPEEKASIETVHFARTVGVESGDAPAVYAQRLVLALRNTGLFDAVETLERLPEPDFIARVERPVHGTAMIPVLPILTLGLIPQWVDEEWGEVFSLRAPDAPAESVLVDFTYTGPTTLGWVASLNNLRADRTGRSPRKTQLYSEALMVAICALREEILGLTSR